MVDHKKYSKWVRWSIYTFNFFYFFVAVTIITMGIWTIYSMRYVSVVDEHFAVFVAMCLFIIGGLILTSGVVSCCGTFWENKILLYVFIGIMWVVLALEIAISIWIFYSLPVVVSSVRPFLSELVRTYSNTSDSQQLNKIQYNYDCCGVDSYKDWHNTTWGHDNHGLFPGSCCHSMLAVCDPMRMRLSEEGCYEGVVNFVDYTFTIDMTTLLCAGFAQVIGITLTYSLTRLVREFEVAADEK